MAIDGKLPPGFPREKLSREWVCRAPVPYATCTKQSPCASCRGRRNQRAGREKQRAARQAIERVTGTKPAQWAGKLGHEETWRFGVRYEAKSGAQVGPIATRFLLAERQSVESKASGDARPFAMLVMPSGWGKDGLVLVRLSELGSFVEACVNQ